MILNRILFFIVLAIPFSTTIDVYAVQVIGFEETEISINYVTSSTDPISQPSAANYILEAESQKYPNGEECSYDNSIAAAQIVFENAGFYKIDFSYELEATGLPASLSAGFCYGGSSVCSYIVGAELNDSDTEPFVYSTCTQNDSSSESGDSYIVAKVTKSGNADIFQLYVQPSTLVV